MERKVSSDVSGTFHNPLNMVGDPSIHDDVGCVVHDHVVVDDEKLSQGFHGHVGKISAVSVQSQNNLILQLSSTS